MTEAVFLMKALWIKFYRAEALQLKEERKLPATVVFTGSVSSPQWILFVAWEHASLNIRLLVANRTQRTHEKVRNRRRIPKGT